MGDKNYDLEKDPEAIKAHDLYLEVIEHLPECASCKRLEFAQLGRHVAIAIGPAGMEAERALELLCPEGHRICFAYWEAMAVWLESMRKRGATRFSVRA